MKQGNLLTIIIVVYEVFVSLLRYAVVDPVNIGLDLGPITLPVKFGRHLIVISRHSSPTGPPGVPDIENDISKCVTCMFTARLPKFTQNYISWPGHLTYLTSKTKISWSWYIRDHMHWSSWLYERAICPSRQLKLHYYRESNYIYKSRFENIQMN